ncbi:MAG: glycosyltransferase [Isosphaeraceae bacterium]
MPAVRACGLLVTHTIVFAGPIAAEVAKVPWASVVLAPMVFLSGFDPPVLPPAPWLRHARGWLGPWFWRALLSAGKARVRRWTRPVGDFRKECGLEPRHAPLFEDAYAGDLVLAMFDPIFGAPQPDWPGNVAQTGFVFLDDTQDASGIDPALNAFLDAGEPPVVFTLGSSAVNDAGRFYEVSLQVTKDLGRRAVLLIGEDPRNVPEGPLPPGVATAPYAPFSELFPRAAAVVHQGGVGTTAQGLRAGVPALVVPWAHDQHDNADRVTRLGMGATVSRHSYNPAVVGRALRSILDDPACAARAAEVGRKIRAHDGVAAACDALADVLRHRDRRADGLVRA